MRINLLSRVKFLDKLLFTKHLSVIIKSGIAIFEALESLTDQTRARAFKNVLSAVFKDVQNGQALAVALKKHPRVFDQFYISMVEVGEEAGTLEESLEFLAKQLAKDYALRQKIKGAMMYPALVFIATAVMGGFISLYILPQLVDFFAAFETELPLPTKILLFFANLMKNYGIILAGSFLAFSFLGYLIIRSKHIKPVWHKLILKAPLFGNLLAYGQLARFSRNLGTLLKSGVPISRGLKTTSQTLNNLAYKNSLKIAQSEVSKGKPLATSLEMTKSYADRHVFLSTELYPGIVTKMVAVGEKTGKLEETLLYLSEFYEDEIDEFSKNLTTILEPVLLITIGLVVGFVALAIISPIYELTGSIRR